MKIAVLWIVFNAAIKFWKFLLWVTSVLGVADLATGGRVMPKVNGAIDVSLRRKAMALRNLRSYLKEKMG